jgi:ubiquinone/menaquinone biosynthesis C-methylase UbiE
MNQRDYYAIMQAAVDLRGKHVLELGGAVPPDLIARAEVGTWTSIDVSPNRFSESLGKRTLPDWYRTHLMSAARMNFADASFDITYSTNCFEHIDDIPAAFAHIHRILKPGGLLFTIFSPIWTGPVGHHTWVWDGNRPLTFQQEIFPDWYHLAQDETGLRPFLERRYRPELVESILGYVYRSHDINRLADADYEREIAKYDYVPIISYRIRSRRQPPVDLLPILRERYPQVMDFRTLGYFWILAKGRTDMRTRLRAYARGAAAVAWRKVRSRLP